MDGALSSRRTDRSGRGGHNKHSHGGSESSRGRGGGGRGRGRGGRGGGRGGHSHDAPSNPMMFPISHQDTSTFQLPITANSSTQQPTRPTKPPRMSNPALVPRRPTSSSTGRHRHGESKEDDEENEDEIDLDDSEDEDYEDDDDDYHEDEGNIFDYAEEAFVDGQKQAQLKQQRVQQQQQQQINKSAGGKQSNQKQRNNNPRTQKQQGSQPQQQQQQQDSARRLVVVTKKEREQQHQQQQPHKQQPQQHHQQQQQQHNHPAPQPSHSSNPQPSESAPSGDGKTHKQRRMEKAALKKLAAEQGNTNQQAAQSTSAHPASGNDQQRQQIDTNNRNNNNNAGGRQNQQPSNGRPRNNGGRGDQRSLFPEHLLSNMMDAGLRTGMYFQGLLRVIGQNAFVTVAGLPRDVFIEGRRQRNRAFDGDTVCIQIVGTDTGAGTATQQIADQAKDKRQQAKAQQKLSKQAQETALSTSLESLIIDSEKKEDEKMAAERSGDKITSEAASFSSSTAPQDPSTVGMEQRTVQSLPHQSAIAREALAKLAAAGSNVQYKGVVVGIITPKFEVVKAPGLLKPFAEHIALFVPLDKKTPFAMLPERSWPPGFAATYRKYWQEEKARQEAKKKELQQRKGKGNFPLSDEDSSDVVNSPMERQNSSESNDLADADNAPVLDDHIYVACYQPWNANDRQPFCTISTNLGLSGNIITETEALLVANGVDYDHDGKFGPGVLNEVAKYSRESSNNSGGWQIPAEEIAQRRDLRDQTKWRIVSIDPTTARDLDDAIHVIDLGNDVIECGVHIADVSHFVRPGTLLDAEARHRATTIYLVNKAIPMLPPILCEQLCSLNPNVDRLAYTTIFYLNKSTGKLIPDRKPWFGKTVIRTCARLNYETAQLLMEFDDSSIKASGRPVTEEDFEGELRKNMSRGHPYRPVDCVSIQQLLSDMKLLHAVSMRRREDRFVMGSLTLSNVKLQFQTDAQQNPIGFYSYPIRDSNRVVEEQMLLANMVVAHQCVQFCQNMALLRCHPSPNEKAMSKVSQTCAELGFSINASTAGSLQKSLESYQGVFVGKRHGINDAVLIDGSVPLRQVLEPLCTKPMQLAKYFATSMADDPRDWHHYALHFAEYTHFTSPIRRYADIIVHRILSLSLEIEAWKNSLSASPSVPRPRGHPSLHPDEVAQISEQCNTRKASAKKAQEQSSKVYLCDYLLKFHAKTPLSSSAVLTDLASTEGHSDPTFDILIPHLGIEKKIHLNDLLRDGKIVAGDIFPKDPAQANANQAGGKNNSAANQKARAAQAAATSSSSSSSSASSATAPVAKSQKRLRIEWADGTKNVYSMFDAIDVELVVRRGPPLDLDAFVISPAVAAEREKNKQNDVKEREELEAAGGQESLLPRSASPLIASDVE